MLPPQKNSRSFEQTLSHYKKPIENNPLAELYRSFLYKMIGLLSTYGFDAILPKHPIQCHTSGGIDSSFVLDMTQFLDSMACCILELNKRCGWTDNKIRNVFYEPLQTFYNALWTQIQTRKNRYCGLAKLWCCADTSTQSVLQTLLNKWPFLNQPGATHRPFHTWAAFIEFVQSEYGLEIAQGMQERFDVSKRLLLEPGLSCLLTCTGEQINAALESIIFYDNNYVNNQENRAHWSILSITLPQFLNNTLYFKPTLVIEPPKNTEEYSSYHKELHTNALIENVTKYLLEHPEINRIAVPEENPSIVNIFRSLLTGQTSHKEPLFSNIWHLSDKRNINVIFCKGSAMDSSRTENTVTIQTTYQPLQSHATPLNIILHLNNCIDNSAMQREKDEQARVEEEERKYTLTQLRTHEKVLKTQFFNENDDNPIS